MIKNITKLEIKKGEREYQFYVENNSPLGEIFDVLTEYRNYVLERLKNVDAQSSNEEKTCPLPVE